MIINDVLKSLLPLGAYSANGPNISRHILAEAELFAELSAVLGRLHGALHPKTAVHDLEEWERLYAITPSPGSSLQQRSQAISSKQAEVGGLSKDYFKRLARAAGYAITILEPAPFEVGRCRCGDALYREEIRFVWQVHIDERPIGSTLASDEALEATFKDLKAAHTYCQFI
ncbi:putative phage tail protein [Luteibacter yeojuensis]|uniref:putative phage tail protein n=1 Tax=Luteibacter yeojuensis TaxID=345309 RepID=UPI0006984407|nr:putative phage tail protein [Luteibacter yeojuensis]